MKRRLIVGVDGTWQTALHQTHPANLSNVARLLNAVPPIDSSWETLVPQLKLYIPGVGTGEEVAAGAVHGATGEGVLEKVRGAYYWIAQNWRQGDEIYCIGFSRGAYIIRLLCTTIHLLGILDPKSTLSLFPAIFDALCANWNPHKLGGEEGAKKLEPLLEAIKPRKEEQLKSADGGFLIQAVGLFDTVPLYHLHPLPAASPSSASPTTTTPHLSPLGLPDAVLEPHIKHAYQALAINEERDAYQPLLWEVGPGGLKEGQTLEQTWFAGVHTDVGGGNSIHDLSDVTLAWLASRFTQIEVGLAIDLEYFQAVAAHPAAPWGAMKPRVRPHHILPTHPRTLPFPPTTSSSPTGPSAANNYQSFHPSILCQSPSNLPSSLLPLLSNPSHPLLIPLRRWEKMFKDSWPVKAVQPVPTSGDPKEAEVQAEHDAVPSSPPPSPSTGAPPPPAPVPLHTITHALSAFLPVTRKRPHLRLRTEMGSSDVSTEKKVGRERREMRALVQDLRDAQAKIEGAGDSHKQRRGR